MVVKNIFYKESIKDIIRKIEFAERNKKISLFTPANSCLLAMTFTCIYKWRNILYRDINDSFILKPIDLNEKKIINPKEFLKEDLKESTKEMFFKSDLFIYLFIYLLGTK